ncbi:MAG: FIST N-terminal domain-containing protein [Acidimicrobiia bacterium]
MPFAASLSTHPDAATAVGEIVGEVTERLGGSAPELAVLFLSASHVAAADEIAATVQSLLDPRAFIGASAVGVLAGHHGVEDAPGLSLWAGRLPGRITPFHLTAVEDGEAWRIAGLPTFDDTIPTMILLPDPFTFPLNEFVSGLGQDRPRLAVIGGLASAARQSGGNRLIIGGRVVRHGAVGVLLDVPLAPTTVVSQGCRPIGQPFTVTRSERNVLFELAGRPALDRLLELIESLPGADKALAAQGVHCGIVADEHKLDFERGDFLIRGVLGADRSTGAIVVGEEVPVGATIQFQVRDASTAGEDLRSLLDGHTSDGALVFTCNGRGTFMFGDADHDAKIVSDQLGTSAIAGMFCAGEIGPVAGRNALHGFTASVALFSD